MGFKDLILELKNLNLPPDQFAIFGSGPLGIRGLKESNDLDIIVKEDLWNELSKKYPVQNEKLITIGEIEFYKHWKPWYDNTDFLIDTADIIDGIRFVKLEQVLKWKKEYNREKDIADVKLIEEYLR
jgi:hypothetical protein